MRPPHLARCRRGCSTAGRTAAGRRSSSSPRDRSLERWRTSRSSSRWWTVRSRRPRAARCSAGNRPRCRTGIGPRKSRERPGRCSCESIRRPSWPCAGRRPGWGCPSSGIAWPVRPRSARERMDCRSGTSASTDRRPSPCRLGRSKGSRIADDPRASTWSAARSDGSARACWTGSRSRRWSSRDLRCRLPTFRMSERRRSDSGSSRSRNCTRRTGCWSVRGSSRPFPARRCCWSDAERAALRSGLDSSGRSSAARAVGSRRSWRWARHWRQASARWPGTACRWTLTGSAAGDFRERPRVRGNRRPCPWSSARRPCRRTAHDGNPGAACRPRYPRWALRGAGSRRANPPRCCCRTSWWRWRRRPRCVRTRRSRRWRWPGTLSRPRAWCRWRRAVRPPARRRTRWCSRHRRGWCCWRCRAARQTWSRRRPVLARRSRPASASGGLRTYDPGSALTRPWFRRGCWPSRWASCRQPPLRSWPSRFRRGRTLAWSAWVVLSARRWRGRFPPRSWRTRSASAWRCNGLAAAEGPRTVRMNRWRRRGWGWCRRCAPGRRRPAGHRRSNRRRCRRWRRSWSVVEPRPSRPPPGRWRQTTRAVPASRPPVCAHHPPFASSSQGEVQPQQWEFRTMPSSRPQSIRTDSPKPSVRNRDGGTSCSRRACSNACSGSSIPSLVNWNVPKCIPRLVDASRSRWACTASAGFIWTACMNQRGSYAPTGRSARSIGPIRCLISRKNGPYALSPAKKMRRWANATTNPPHSERFRSNGLLAEKCRAGVSVVRIGAVVDSCHQSSSSTRRMPADRRMASFARGVTTMGSSRSASRRSVCRSQWS